ncbi:MULTISPECIES: response regulator transcription factor [Methylosinus]|uniref:DNA-binding response regulator n=2 Tax=Methylosinus trichosporium TaxID=426 RepID=A0A2D2D2Y4_METT3|nr:MULTISPECIES: response regulator transcription factor [Methylosinus]ATQ69358.1 DNA-binding response regulator [Methylosinus trichosporium OB3b]OBS52874.1 two-component system response regulator [Methylosinus sp. 3S-1]
MRILLIEDESEMARLIASLVAHAGFVIDRVGTLGDALASLRVNAYDLLLLDRRLPDGDGISLLPEVRAAQPGIRVMMITALDGLTEKISGLEAGADDYLTKPFQGAELIARIRACLRRPGGDVLPPIRVGAVAFDLDSNEVTVAGRTIILTRREMMLLRSLMQRASRVAARETLIQEIYGVDEEVQANALDSIVSRLRKQLAAYGARIEIHTVKGRGYLLTEQAR